MNPYAEHLVTWLLVLVIDGDLQERQTFDTHRTCMSVGHGMVESTLVPTTQDWEIEGTLNGFFCEEQKPEETTQVTPICLAPTRECS